MVLKNSALELDVCDPRRRRWVGAELGCRFQAAWVAELGVLATSFASFLRFWAVTASTNSVLTPRGPLSRSRSSRRIRFRCAKSISTFLRSRRDRSKAGVSARDLAKCASTLVEAARDLSGRSVGAAAL